MKKYKWVLILVNLVLLLALFNHSIFKKEEILKDGKLVLLELAPVDPRSLMQGDYMQLSYEISQNIEDTIGKRGYCVVKLDSQGIARRQRFQKEEKPRSKDEILIPYTRSHWNINIGAESYFFQEGQGEKFASAKFGGLKVDDQGHSILVGLYDERHNKIE